MKNTEIVTHLISLVHLDIDATHAYAQAIEKIDVKSIQDKLTHFRSDHVRHVENLSELITTLGGEAPPFSRDFKGFILEGMTALRSVTGTEGALMAMRMNEKLTNTAYDRALAWDVPQHIKHVIEQNRDDERRHLEYIETAIDDRLWEEKGKVA